MGDHENIFNRNLPKVIKLETYVRKIPHLNLGLDTSYPAKSRGFVWHACKILLQEFIRQRSLFAHPFQFSTITFCHNYSRLCNPRYPSIVKIIGASNSVKNTNPSFRFVWRQSYIRSPPVTAFCRAYCIPKYAFKTGISTSCLVGPIE